MPSRAEIAKMGGDDDREDKERVMAGFLQAVGVQMYWPGQKGLLIWIFYLHRNARNSRNNYHNRVHDTSPDVIVGNEIQTF